MAPTLVLRRRRPRARDRCRRRDAAAHRACRRARRDPGRRRGRRRRSTGRASIPPVGVLNAEPGVDEAALWRSRRAGREVRRWPALHHYFGGVSVGRAAARLLIRDGAEPSAYGRRLMPQPGCRSRTARSRSRCRAVASGCADGRGSARLGRRGSSCDSPRACQDTDSAEFRSVGDPRRRRSLDIEPPRRHGNHARSSPTATRACAPGCDARSPERRAGHLRRRSRWGAVRVHGVRRRGRSAHPLRGEAGVRSAILLVAGSGERVEHRGRHYQVNDVTLAPPPVQRVPIWIGGNSTRARARAARFDGWFADTSTAEQMSVTPDGYGARRTRPGTRRLRRHRARLLGSGRSAHIRSRRFDAVARGHP